MNYFKKILPYIFPYKKFAALNIFFNILYAFFSSLSFVVLMPLLELIFRNKNEPEVEIKKPVYEGILELDEYFNDFVSYQISIIAGDNKETMLLVVIGLIITVFLFKNIFSYLAFYFLNFLRNGVLTDLRDDMYKKTISLPIYYFSEKRKGDIMARIGTDVIEVQYSFLAILEMIFRDPLMIIVTIVIMTIMSVELTLFVFIFIPIAGFIINIVGKNLKKTSDKIQAEQGYFLSLLEETLTGLKIIKGFNAENVFVQKFQDSTKRFEKHMNKLLTRIKLAGPLSETLGIVVFSVLLWYGGGLVLIDESIEPGAFIAYLGLAYNILTPAKEISKASYTIKKGNAAAERILQVLETEDPLEDSPNAINKTDFNTVIEFKNISFKYEDEYVVKNFSMKVPKGQTVALVGQSGSGKSTLANLVTRFYDVVSGSLEIDGVNIKEIKKESLLGLMGIVAQDSILFNDSVANNIKLGNQSVSREEIIHAAKVSYADEFIKELPEKYETNIGDGGNKLSGGQKQRLSIARAVLKNPPIMILDEAMSALDTESEQIVQMALEKMMENRTSLMIAHRLSTIQNADNIVVLRKGEIIEQGKHEELMSKKGEYHKLVTLQSLK